MGTAEDPAQLSEVNTSEGAFLDGAAAAMMAAAPGGDVSEKEANLLCPFFMAKGECRYGDKCAYTHADMCDMCGIHILHPSDESQREEHIKVS